MPVGIEPASYKGTVSGAAKWSGLLTLFQAVKHFVAQNLFLYGLWGKLTPSFDHCFYLMVSLLLHFFCFSLKLLETLSQMWSPAITTIQDNGVIFPYSTHYLVYYFSCLFFLSSSRLSQLKKESSLILFVFISHINSFRE